MPGLGHELLLSNDSPETGALTRTVTCYGIGPLCGLSLAQRKYHAVAVQPRDRVSARDAGAGYPVLFLAHGIIGERLAGRNVRVTARLTP